MTQYKRKFQIDDFVKYNWKQYSLENQTGWITFVEPIDNSYPLAKYSNKNKDLDLYETALVYEIAVIDKNTKEKKNWRVSDIEISLIGRQKRLKLF